MAKAHQSKEIILPLELSVSESTHAALSAAVGSEQVSAPVKALLEGFLVQFTNGGIVVTGSDIDHMSKASGDKITKADQIVALVDKASGQKAGAYEFLVGIDPNMIGQFEEVAMSRGMTLAEIVSEMWDSAMAEGWFYDIPTPCTHFFINEAQHQAVAKIIGKNSFNGTDIINALVKASGK